MDNPSIGMPGVLPEGEGWDANQVEKLLRSGGLVYLGQGLDLQIASFNGDKFRVEGLFGRSDAYENEDFVEFMAHVLFFGRDFL